MKVKLNTGVEVNIPESIDDMRFRDLVNFDTWQTKINNKIKELAKADDVTELSINADLFVMMVNSLAEVTDTKPDDWMNQEVGDIREALISGQVDDPEVFHTQKDMLSAMYRVVCEAAMDYTEPSDDFMGDYEFKYRDYDKGETRDTIVTWSIPLFMRDVYGGKKPKNLLTWQVIEAKEAERSYQMGLELYREKNGSNGYEDAKASAIYTRTLVEVASLSSPKGRKIYRPKTNEAVKEHIGKLMNHFRDIGARQALDIAFFLGYGIRQQVREAITNTISSHRRPEGEQTASKE